MSEHERPTFLFTSGVGSPHHAHLGYGLKRGLEGAPRVLILTLESACVEVVALRREGRGAIIALDSRGEEVWRGRVIITAGHDLAGRPNLAVSGVCPEESALNETRSWCWRPDEDHAQQTELVTSSELNDYLDRNRRGADAHMRSEHPELASHDKPRYAQVLVGLFIALMVYAYVSQRGSVHQRSDPRRRGDAHPRIQPELIQPQSLTDDSTAHEPTHAPHHEPHHEQTRDLID